MEFEKKVWFEKINKNIFCILSEPQTNLKKLVIMSHGFRGSSIGPARTFVDFAKVLNENGFSVLRFDQPNSGNSEGDYIESSFREWVETIEFFGDKYLNLGYEVVLLGQSMGASAVMVSTNQPKIISKINKILLWVPDPETDFNGDKNEIGEEAGQLYKNSFWQEAMEMNFFGCVDKYTGKVHLVYGEFDKYVSQELRNKTIEKAKSKGWAVKVLQGEDHSSWSHKKAQEVYKEELEFLKK